MGAGIVCDQQYGHLFGKPTWRFADFFLKISIRSESGASLRRTFDHNLWEL